MKEITSNLYPPTFRVNLPNIKELVELKPSPLKKIEQNFLSMHKILKPRHQRDIKRLFAIIKSFALLNLWHRDIEGSIVLTSDEDIEEGFRIWEGISISQELNLPPYIYRVFEEIILPLYQEKQVGLTRKEIMRGYLRIYSRPIAEWQLRREIIPMLEMAGLIVQEQDPDDRRNKLIIPSYPTIQSIISKPEIM